MNWQVHFPLSQLIISPFPPVHYSVLLITVLHLSLSSLSIPKFRVTIPSHLNTPTVVIVPGFWEGRETYNATTREIISAGYACTTVQLPSTGTVPPNNPTMHDDINAIRRVLENILEREGKEIVLVMHSAGGFLGSNAIEGMSVEERKAQGKDGGVRKLLVLTAGLLPEGTLHTTPPFGDIHVCDSWRVLPCQPLHLILASLYPPRTH